MTGRGRTEQTVTEFKARQIGHHEAPNEEGDGGSSGTDGPGSIGAGKQDR
ncbi:UNVERIFIED_ORG: hypothetical protein ABID57_003512 [Arthrobacter sp. UYEF1]